MINFTYLLFLAIICSSKNEDPSKFRLRILHNNDLHSRFHEIDENGAECSEDLNAENKCYGGFARIKQAVNDAKKEAEKEDIPIIFLNAGDTFKGTPYYTEFKWEIVADLINALDIDVMSLGNHEFDDGVDNLVSFLEKVKTPVVCANLDRDTEQRLNLPKLTNSVPLTIEGKKIGVVGYLTPDTKKHSSTPEHLVIHEEIDKIRDEVRYLKEEKGAEIIIALGHSGIEMDIKIAELVEDVDIVIGGHTNTFMHTPKDHYPSKEKPDYEYPYMAKQASGKEVPVVQAYAYSKYLGMLTVEFNENGKLVAATGNPLLLDYTVEKDPSIETLLEIWENKGETPLNEVIGYTRTSLEKPNYKKGELQSNLANLINDALLDLAVELAKQNKEQMWTKSAIAFYPNGGIGTTIDRRRNNGALTRKDLMTILPHKNQLVQIALKGSTIKEAIELTVDCFDTEIGILHTRCWYLHFGGLKIVHDMSRERKNRIESVKALCAKCDVPKYEPLHDDEIYEVITIKYLADGKGEFDMLREQHHGITFLDEFTDLEALIIYLKKRKIVYPIEDNRVAAKGFKNKVTEEPIF